MKILTSRIRLILRYSLFQIPSLALLIIAIAITQKFVELPFWLYWAGILAWILKDIILFPFTWRAYEKRNAKTLDNLVGSVAIVEKVLSPRGCVLIRGELWQAETGDGTRIEKGKPVIVHGYRGIVLVVKPMEGSLDSS